MESEQKYQALDSIIEDAPTTSFSTQINYSPDVESVAQQMKENYEEVYGEEKEVFFDKVRNCFLSWFKEKTESPLTISEERTSLVHDLTYIANNARKTLQKAGMSVNKMNELEQEIDSDIQSSRTEFLSLREYLTRVDDGLEYVTDKLSNPENMDEENSLSVYHEQLIQKKETVEIELDHLSQKVELNFNNRDYLRENLKYASIESAAIERALLSAQQSAAILESTKELSEYIKGGRLVAQLHQIFEKVGNLDSKMSYVMSQNLVGSSNLPSTFALSAEEISKTNSEVHKKVAKQRKQRIVNVANRFGVA